MSTSLPIVGDPGGEDSRPPEPPRSAAPAPPASKGRRRLLGGLLSAAVAGAAGLFARPSTASESRTWLRPPGALPEQGFTDACTRCFKCADACPNDCISFHPLTAGLKIAFTPRITARARGCILCGDCADACPSGALQPFGPSAEDWLANVDMGLARVNKDLCFSFHGRTCGACYRACPLPGKALKIGVFETPHIQPEHCVGCGLCEQACLHLPQAVRVLPRRMVGPRTDRQGHNRGVLPVHGPYGSDLGQGPSRWGPISETATSTNAEASK